MNLNVCIIGCGDMGRQHAAGWAARADSQIASLFDVQPERLCAMASETGATGYESYCDAIMQDGIDVVSVCVPACFHSEISCFAMRNGRHVLCEKPLALTIDQADEMIDTADSTGMLLSTSFQYRGFTRVEKMRQLFADGAFGSTVFVRFTDIREVRPKLAMHMRSMNGGPVIDMSGHFFDLMRYITGKEPISVYAKGHVFGKGKDRLSEVDDFAIDAADIQVEMQDSHMLNVMVNWGMPEGYPTLTEELLIGPSMSLRAASGLVEMVTGTASETWDMNEGNPPGSSVRINDIADAIIVGRQPSVTGEDGRTALRISLAALESIETGQIVRL